MLERFTPYADSASQIPVFQVEARHISNAQNFRVLLEKTNKRLVIITVPLIAIIFVLSLVSTPSYGAYRNSSSLVELFFVAAVFSIVYVDFYAMMFGMQSVNSEITKGRWDLLRMTGLGAGQFILAKHQVVQLKVWFKMITVMAVRLASVILMMMSFLFSAPLHLILKIEYFILFAFFLLFSVMFVLEPIYRMRAVSALSVMVSASTKGGVMSPLAGIGVIFGMWILQAVTTIFFLLCSSVIFMPFFIFMGYLIPFCLHFFLTAGFYKFVQDVALRRAGMRLRRGV